MNKAERGALDFVVAMCRDAYGNALTGQPERSIGFIGAATKLLVAMQEYSDAKGDFRAEAKLKEAVQSTFAETEALPAYDATKVETALKEAKERGLWQDGVLQALDPEDIPESSKVMGEA
jgi:hypothetical protein